MTDPDPGSYGRLAICFSTSERIRKLAFRKFLPAVLELFVPGKEPLLKESLAVLFGGARSRRFATVQCGGDYSVSEFDFRKCSAVLDALRDGQFPGTFYIQNTSCPPSDLSVFFEKYGGLFFVIRSLRVNCKGTVDSEGDFQSEAAWLRLAGVPNLTI